MSLTLCAERLPEENTDVLCVGIFGDFLIGKIRMYTLRDGERPKYYAENEFTCIENCIAWQELPAVNIPELIEKRTHLY